MPAFCFLSPSLSSAGGKNAQVIMVTGSADGAFGILFPFFDVQVWPFSAIDLSRLCNSVCPAPANGNGPSAPVGCSTTSRGTDSIVFQV